MRPVDVHRYNMKGQHLFYFLLNMDVPACEMIFHLFHYIVAKNPRKENLKENKKSARKNFSRNNKCREENSYTEVFSIRINCAILLGFTLHVLGDPTKTPIYHKKLYWNNSYDYHRKLVMENQKYLNGRRNTTSLTKNLILLEETHYDKHAFYFP